MLHTRPWVERLHQALLLPRDDQGHAVARVQEVLAVDSGAEHVCQLRVQQNKLNPTGTHYQSGWQKAAEEARIIAYLRPVAPSN